MATVNLITDSRVIEAITKKASGLSTERLLNTIIDLSDTWMLPQGGVTTLGIFKGLSEVKLYEAYKLYSQEIPTGGVDDFLEIEVDTPEVKELKRKREVIIYVLAEKINNRLQKERRALRTKEAKERLAAVKQAQSGQAIEALKAMSPEDLEKEAARLQAEISTNY